jgi:hypothetical protein
MRKDTLKKIAGKQFDSRVYGFVASDRACGIVPCVAHFICRINGNNNSKKTKNLPNGRFEN